MASRRPLDRNLYDSVVDEAKARFAVWPSAYASGWVVQEYKRRGGRYAGERSESQGIAKWFKEEWVDLSRPIRDARGKLVGYEPCGRKHAEQTNYPKCRPLAEAMRMTPEQVRSAVQRKRRVEVRVRPQQGRRPVNVPTYENPGGLSCTINCPCGWSWELEEGDDDPFMCHKCWHRVLGEF